MASALRVISVREGFDPTRHSIVAFGGAGGQHACAIAERLGVRRILHPGSAGLLSAVGIGELRRERVRSESAARRLRAEEVRAAVERARKSLLKESPPLEGARLEIRSIHGAIGWRGQSAVIEMPLDEAPTADSALLVVEASRHYRAVFGSDPPKGDPDLSLVRVVAEWVIDRARPATNPRAAAARSAAPDASDTGPARTARMRSAHGWVDSRLIDRHACAPGVRIDGPAIVADEHSTLVIDDGWTSRVEEDETIVLERVAPERAATSSAPEVRASALAAIATEMGEQLRRTSVSVNVRDRLDYSCGIVDAEGRLATIAPHIPVHLGALGACVRALSAHRRWRNGDLIVTNDPACGGSHLPDVTVVLAVGADERPDSPIAAFVAARAHHAEIGGTRPGSMPPSARTLDEEGVVIPPTVIGDLSRVDCSPVEALLRGARFPTRALDDNLADLAAAIASLRRGAALLRTLSAERGAEMLARTMDELRLRSRDQVIKAIRSLPADFARRIEQRLDDGAPISLRLARTGDRLRVDFTGSSGPHPGNLNAPSAVVRSATMYALRLLVESRSPQDERTLPLNDGLLEPIDLVIPPGLLDPPANAPVAAGNTETSQRVVDTLLLGLGIAACSQGTMNNLIMGGEGWSFYETIAGGTGATPRHPGAAGLHTHMTNTRITDPEILERRWPLRLTRFAFRRDSGAANAASAGGDGLIREIEFLSPTQISFVSQHRASGPDGLDGGAAGSPGRQRVTRAGGAIETLPGIFELDANPGDRLTIETPGGGGCGEPRA